MGVVKKTPIEYARYYLSRLESGAMAYDAENGFMEMHAALKTAGAGIAALDASGKTSDTDMEVRIRAAWAHNMGMKPGLPSYEEICARSNKALTAGGIAVDEKGPEENKTSQEVPAVPAKVYQPTSIVLNPATKITQAAREATQETSRHYAPSRAKKGQDLAFEMLKNKIANGRRLPS